MESNGGQGFSLYSTKQNAEMLNSFGEFYLKIGFAQNPDLY